MKRLVCFGEALIDFLAQPASDATAPRAYLQYAGGAPANVAVAAARLGAPVDFVGMLGADVFGDFLLEQLRDAGVGTEFVERTSAAKTALAFVALDARGERSFSFYRPPSADLLFRPDHFRSACFAAAGVFHVCSNSLTDAGLAQASFEGLRRARAAEALVSVDLNLRPALWPDGVDNARLWAMLAVADVVKLSREELDYLADLCGGAEAAIERLWRGSARWLLVTDGAAPLTWRTRSARGSLDTFAVPVRDTTAAGDAFVGTLLAALVQRGVNSHGLHAFLADDAARTQALRQAAAAGALAVTRHGAFEAMPDRAAVQALLESAA